MSITYIKAICLIMCKPEMKFKNQPSDDIMKIAEGYSVVCDVHENVNTIHTMEFLLFVAPFLIRVQKTLSCLQNWCHTQQYSTLDYTRGLFVIIFIFFFILILDFHWKDLVSLMDIIRFIQRAIQIRVLVIIVFNRGQETITQN